MERRLLVIIPTYNESENIADILDAVINQLPHFDVLVVDDNSNDGTASIVRTKIQQYDRRIFLLSRPNKAGLGSAYVAGFNWSLDKKGYAYVVEMDADFSHPVDKLSTFYDMLERNQAEVIIGSRYIKGGKVENWPPLRQLISRIGSLYTNLLTFLPVKDTTGGFIAYKIDVLRSINMDKLTAQGYAFQIEMKLAVWKLGYKIKEIPITFRDRVRGKSKMNSSIILEAMIRVLSVATLVWVGQYASYIRK